MKIPKFDFIGKFKLFSGISIAFFALIIIFGFVFGVTLDIEFRGGSIITYSYDGDLNTSDFENTVNSLVGTNVTTQKSQNVMTGTQTVVVSLPGNKSLSSDTMLALSEGLVESFPDNNIKTLDINNVDPTTGGEFLAKCIIAVVAAAILMMVYVAFRFRKIGGLSAGAMAVLALVHDTAIAFGVFVIFRIPIDSNFIAVVLTILGYSLNDTIIIYDRIRENEGLHLKNYTLGELVNLSINQSFKRSLMTSLLTLSSMIVVSIVALAFGVDSILSFSFPLTIGLIAGSYSTICIVSPLWVKWQERKFAAR